MFFKSLDFDFDNVIFDLDGTIIDSSASILSSLKYALNGARIRSLMELNSSLIGPPLDELIIKVSGLNLSDPMFVKVKQLFEYHYDNFGIFDTFIFNESVDYIVYCKSKGKNLFIATNKRMVPTIKILQFFSLEEYFKVVYTLDSSKHSVMNKTGLLELIVSSEKLSPERSLFIGDRISDQKAAEGVGMHYAMVPWGYEDSY